MSQKRKKAFKPKIKKMTMEHVLSGEHSPMRINRNAFGVDDMPVMGRPRINFNDDDWRRLQEYVNAQCNADEICAFFGISQDTLSRRIHEKYGISYAEYIGKNNLGGKAAVRRRLFDIAFSNDPGNVTAAIWLSKNFLNMTDKREVEITAQKPIPFAYSLEDKAED